jgi:hypothetical protein
MNLQDWTAKVENGNCVHVYINKDQNLEDLEFTLISDTRVPIMKMKVTNHEIYVCSRIEKPLFAQLGNCVKYVDGSGTEYYSNCIKSNALNLV